jgi:hypothetical protein
MRSLSSEPGNVLELGGVQTDLNPTVLVVVVVVVVVWSLAGTEVRSHAGEVWI